MKDLVKLDAATNNSDVGDDDNNNNSDNMFYVLENSDISASIVIAIVNFLCFELWMFVASNSKV